MRKVYLDFTGIYADEAGTWADYLDMREIRGTDMYCTPQAQEQIRKKIAGYGPEGIHFFDSGNYHYMSKLFAEMIVESFVLILFDHHTDMQKPLMEELLSCGGWAAALTDSSPALAQILVIGPPAASMEEIEVSCRDKVMTIPEEEILAGTWREQLAGWREDLPVYVSIDRDVLDPAYARTNWDQGQLTPDHLGEILEEVVSGRRLIGADFCGELSDSSVALFDKQAARAFNKKTDEKLLGMLMRR